jgi:hypothetical protein
VNTARIEVSIGKGVSTPVQDGPSQAAILVKPHTNTAAVSIRRGMSQKKVFPLLTGFSLTGISRINIARHPMVTTYTGIACKGKIVPPQARSI